MEFPTQICFGITFVFLVIWIGLFTGLNVPEMKRMDDYLKTKCLVNDSAILRRYCPVKSCGETCDTYTGMQCKDVEWVIEQISPDTCNASAPPSLDTCPGNTYCDDGHYCCHRTCTTTGSGDNRRTTCHCTSDTDHHRCMMIPRLCYTLRLFLVYNTTDHLKISTTYDFDTKDNWGKANELQMWKYQQHHLYGCFYNIHNLGLIRWSIAYTKGFWAASGIFAFFVFIGCCVSFGMWINDDVDRGQEKCHMTNLCFWIAIVLGLCLFLPLGLDVHIPEPSRTHLLRLAIIWTVMWSSIYLGYMFWACDGWQRLSACLGSIWESCSACWTSTKETSGKWVHNAKECFWTNWTAAHNWSNRNIDNGLCVRLNGFFCGCCNWCSATIRYVCKERGEQSKQAQEPEPPMPEPETEDALSAVVVGEEFKRAPPSYRTAMNATDKKKEMTCYEKCMRLWCNTYSASSQV